MKLAALVLAFCVASVLGDKRNKNGKYFDPLSDEFINHINSLQTTWKVRLNFLCV